MSMLALRETQTRPCDWRAVLSETGPQLAEEGRRCDATNEFVARNIAALRERGFLELGVPEEFGGAGLPRAELATMLRTLAGYCGATALVLSMHLHTVAAVVWRWQNMNAPMEGLLKRIAAERLHMLSSGGSDWLAGSGRAQKVDNGYRIFARKVFASGAPAANLYMTMAVDEDAADGPEVLHFAVPMHADGVSIVETWDTLGMRGTGSHDVVFNGVFVPDAAISARRKPGLWHPTMHLASLMAFPLIYSVYAGIAEAARNIAVDMASKRRDPSVIDAVGALETELAATRIAIESMVAFAATAQPGPEATNTIFIHRALIGRGAMKTVDLALEVAGGGSYFRRSGLERLMRDVQAARFHPLQSGPQRRIAGRLALGLPIDG